MKKLILALVALAFAFAISSCCDQNYCPGNKKCGQMKEKCGQKGQEETPYRWDHQDQTQTNGERQHRRW
ncbi:MAG: hypothetical protein WCF19_01755 [Chlamydiales bacterium]